MDAIVATAEPNIAARFLFFTNECVGLGHLRRTMNLAEAVICRDAAASALVVTGAATSLRRDAHPRIDTVKLPELARDGYGALRAARLGVNAPQLHALRSQLAVAAAQSFDPSVAVVDKTPFGLSDELIPALRALRDAGRSRIVLGLRDIEDAPDEVRRRWSGQRLRDQILAYYDAVLVYGPHPGGDILDCMHLPDLGIPVHHVGYVGGPLPVAAPPDLPHGYLLVTAGGGADGAPVFRAVLGALARHAVGVPVVMVTGPLMPPVERAEIEARAATLGVTVFGARDDMQEVIVGARAVVAMAGYNTVSEVLRAGKPLLLMPRRGPSREQVLRAAALHATGAATVMFPDLAPPAAVAGALDTLLFRSKVRLGTAVPHDGAGRAARILCDLAGSGMRRARRELALAGTTTR